MMHFTHGAHLTAFNKALQLDSCSCQRYELKWRRDFEVIQGYLEELLCGSDKSAVRWLRWQCFEVTSIIEWQHKSCLYSTKTSTKKSPPPTETLCDMMQVWASPKPPASHWISQPRSNRCQSQMITAGYSYDWLHWIWAASQGRYESSTSLQDCLPTLSLPSYITAACEHLTLIQPNHFYICLHCLSLATSFSCTEGDTHITMFSS